MWPQGSSGPPAAVMQLMQSLQAVQAASGMPQQRTASQQPGRSAELDALSQLLSAHQQQAQQPGSQLGGTSQGPSSLPSAAAPPQQAASSVNEAGHVKDLIARLLGQPLAQQLQPQPQPEQPPGMLQLAVPDQSWSAPSPHSNNSVTVPQHSMLPAPGMRDLQQQPQQRPAQQDNSIVQLCCTLLEVLQAKGQQQPQPAGQMQAPPPQHQPPGASGVPSPVAQALAAAMPSQQVNAAALAAAAGFTTPQNLAAYAAAAPAAAAHRPAPAYPAGPVGSAPMVPPPLQQPQQQAPGMPALLDQLRAAIGSHAPGAGAGGGQTPDQQRLMGVVDQLQAAWASLGGRDPAAAAGQTTSAAGAASGAGAAAASSAAAGASAEDLSRASGLNMLLAAVQQHVGGTPAGVTHPLAPSGAPGQLPGSGYAMGVHPGAAMYGSEYAAAGWGRGWDQDQSYLQHQPYHHQQQQQQQSGGPGWKHDWEAEYRLQQQQLAAGGGGLAAAVAAAMMQEEGMVLGASLQDSVIDPTVEEQKFLLKPRARGKRQVKPNQVALTGELPPVYERWAHKGAQQQHQHQQQRVLGRALSGGAPAAAAAAAAAGGDSSDDDELWRPPRSRASRKRRRTTHGQGSEDGTAAASATSPGDQQGAGAAAGASKGSAGTARRGYGWQLLHSQEQQQPPQQPREREETASPVEGTPEGGWTGGDGVTEGLGRSYSCTVSGMDGAALEVTPDGGSEDAGGSEGGPASASAGMELGAGGKARARKPAVKRDRWVPPTEEWTSEDGLKVMPKDTQICPGARVFYVQYKWVQQYWPNALATPDNHIASHPAHFYLDGHETDVQLTAKLRLYRKAVHLVISPYSALAKKFVRKWLAGYAFDQERQVMRIYLSTLKPKPPKLEVAEPDPAEITAAAAAAAEWAATAAAQFAAGPVGADAQQQLASQLAALANMLQPKGKASKDSKRSAAAGLTTQPLQRPQDVLQLPQPGQATAAAAVAGAGAEAAAGAQQLQPAPQALPQQQDQQQPELAQGPQPPAVSSEALVEPQMPQQQPLLAASTPTAAAAEHEQGLQEAAGPGLSTPPSPTTTPQQQQQQALPGALQPEPATGEAPQAAEGGVLASPQEVAQEVSVSEGPPASGHSPGCSAPLEPAGTTQQ